MIQFNARRFTILMRLLEIIRFEAQNQPQDEIPPDTFKETCLRNLDRALKISTNAGLNFTAICLKRIINHFEEAPTNGYLAKEIPIALERMADELGTALFMQITSDKANYYSEEPLFGEAVVNKFPKMAGDIQEAGKCFATGRYTASVFHLMRIMEYATQYLGKRLGISLVGEKNWHNILDEVDKAIKALSTKNSRQKSIRNRYAEASAHLRMVKDAWRNDVMHPKETYTEEEAERVFRNVKDFMVHLATKI